jgi:hypothetical protein
MLCENRSARSRTRGLTKPAQNMGLSIAQREPGSAAGGGDQSVHDALTDLSMYALTLDAERHRLNDRLVELVAIESSLAQRRAVLRERDEIAEELTALRRAITALREQLRQ